MKDILTAPWMVEMIRTVTNMYDHGWDERNGGNVSLLLEGAKLPTIWTVRFCGKSPRAFPARRWRASTSLSPARVSNLRMCSTPRR